MRITTEHSRLSPLLKYPGGKEKELKYIIPNLPQKISKYYEPFVGGGAVNFAVQADSYFINDKSAELISLYKFVKNQNQGFLSKIQQIDHNWGILSAIIISHASEILEIYYSYYWGEISINKLKDLIANFVLVNANEFNGILTPNFNVGIENFVVELNKNFTNKIVRLKTINENNKLNKGEILLNIECAFKSAFYMHFRHLYNNAKDYELSNEFRVAIYFFIREFCYSSMFRYNSHGEFNVPYGGISYNNKSLSKKLEYFCSTSLNDQLKRTECFCMDFYDFINEVKPNKDDFIFLDPPYDTEFSTYAKEKFDKDDQLRLSNYLHTECTARFMLVIKETPFISSLYKSGDLLLGKKELVVKEFNKNYLVSFQDRNDKRAKHLIITNY